MSERICAECSTTISDDNAEQIMFCSRYCTIQYLQDHDSVPNEPVYRTEELQ
jgi:hypothetical protein